MTKFNLVDLSVTIRKTELARLAFEHAIDMDIPGNGDEGLMFEIEAAHRDAEAALEAQVSAPETIELAKAIGSLIDLINLDRPKNRQLEPNLNMRTARFLLELLRENPFPL